MSSRATAGVAKRTGRAGRPETRRSDRRPPREPGQVWRDQLIMLLQIAAATEHALMVQYLYAAYSLNLEQQREDLRKMVWRWQKSLLAIAKEEMGHLLTVQNLLTLVGGPVNLEREDFPWDSPHYPFPFRLEPLTKKSLACYVFAEKPGDKDLGEPGKETEARYDEPELRKAELDRIEEFVKQAVEVSPRGGNADRERLYGRYVDEILKRKFPTPKHRLRALQGIIEDGEKAWKNWQSRASAHRVGELYEEIICLIADPERIPDSTFLEGTFSIQASWDDWGRGYKPDPTTLNARGDRPEPSSGRSDPLPPPSEREAHVMVERMATRTQAIDALRAIAGQGEAPHLESDETGEPSHFERFVEIYKEFERVEKIPGWRPALDLAVNPTTRSPKEGGTGAFIENEESRYWAKLFNLRYRMLLTYLAHTFRLARVSSADEPSVRAVVMHKAFAEMYNLKTLAGILVGLPLGNEPGGGGTRAGPPFEIPYSLRLPHGPDAWLLHRDLLAAAGQLIDELLSRSPEGSRRQRYLQTLKDLDGQSLAWINRMVAGGGSTERQRV